ncbi:MAG: FAD binding domain-containing protein [Treponema sp.]|jgi:CO/xanthine dehydrogenase FAD-binding subunit|nr:FAD binding domain-containing protein [Treponema sp.]
MSKPPSQLFFPVSFNELFSAWNRFPAAVPYAGGTDLIGRQGKSIIDLPPVILCLEKIGDLHRITRSEHYLEIGAMVKLNRLSKLGKIAPPVLCACLENIGGVQLRNIATIGGNICSASRMYDIPALLAAFDAKYELRNANNTRWVSASRFHSTDDKNRHITVLENQELLTRIRLPLHQWDYSIYKKLHPNDMYNNEILIFLAKARKNILSDIKVVYKANTILRNKNAEDILIGKQLPLNHKIAVDFIDNWKEFLAEKDELNEFSKNALLNYIEENVFIISD